MRVATGTPYMRWPTDGVSLEKWKRANVACDLVGAVGDRALGAQLIALLGPKSSSTDQGFRAGRGGARRRRRLEWRDRLGGSMRDRRGRSSAQPSRALSGAQAQRPRAAQQARAAERRTGRTARVRGGAKWRIAAIRRRRGGPLTLLERGASDNETPWPRENGDGVSAAFALYPRPVIICENFEATGAGAHPAA